MFMQFPSKDRGPIGNQCRETGAKIGRAVPILMANHSLLRSRRATDDPSSPTMWLRLVGLSAKLLAEAN